MLLGNMDSVEFVLLADCVGFLFNRNELLQKIKTAFLLTYYRSEDIRNAKLCSEYRKFEIKHIALYNKPSDRVKEALGFGKKQSKTFEALKDVSFNVKKGETVGIIGTNGAGKSTLLKIVTGVLVRQQEIFR